MDLSMRQINWDDLESLYRQNRLQAEITGGKKTALTIGVFDGLHRGHQALIAKITEKAPEFFPAVITFRNNPKKIEDIISFEEKMALLKSFGIALAVVIDFSEFFSKIKGRGFLETLKKYLCPAYIGMGVNFHCGHNRETGAEAFKAMALSLDIEAEIIPPVTEGGLVISSSRIRAALKEGRNEEAALLLGRPVNHISSRPVSCLLH
jgi:riboflavin kinase/FMN adenylyltransferase